MKYPIFILTMLCTILSISCQITNAQPNKKQGKFRDSRDGQVYPTIKLNGKTWMAKNLNYNARNSISVPGYGRLYRIGMAKRACPKGWRLPTDREFASLAKAFGGYGKIGQNIKWIGTNPSQAFQALYASGQSGFHAVPSGQFYEGRLQQIGTLGHYWTSTTNPKPVFYRFIKVYNAIYRIASNLPADAAFSCRCVKGKKSLPKGGKRIAPKKNKKKTNPNKKQQESKKTHKPKPRKKVSPKGAPYNPSHRKSKKSKGRKPKSSVVTYLSACKSCKIYGVTLYNKNFRVHGKKEKSGRDWKFTFPNIKPGHYNIEVEGLISSGKKPDFDPGKADIVRPKLSYSPKRIQVKAGKVNTLRLRMAKPVR